MSDPINVAYQGTSTLPPPGDARRDTLKQRTDDLQERGEKMAAEQELESFDPSKLSVDREIQYSLSALGVSGRKKGYEYKWVRDPNTTAGPSMAVTKEVSRTVAYNGVSYPTWQVVMGEMPEALERKTVSGDRRVGDCILLRIESKVKALLDWKDKQKNEIQEQSVNAQLQELGQRYGTRVETYAKTDVNNAVAQSVAMGQFNEQLKTGAVGGLAGPQ